MIFASIAIRALRSHEQYATPWAIDGICKLIKKFDRVSSGRGYFGKKNGWKTANKITLSGVAQVKPYRSIQEMIDLTMVELIEGSSVKTQGFGGYWHLINHAAGIVELDRLGYQTLAKSALPAHRQHMQLIRALPDLSEERRKDLVKVAGRYAEACRVAIRNIRRDGIETARKAEKDGLISEDDRHTQENKVQKLTDEFVKKVDDALSHKEKEITQVVCL